MRMLFAASQGFMSAACAARDEIPARNAAAGETVGSSISSRKHRVVP
jgi:hypothetical protein